MLYGALGYNLYFDWGPANSYTRWQMAFWPHWDIGGSSSSTSSPSWSASFSW